ncbi:MAG: hypothetical protein A3C56_13665 [Ignavibacteria bacterium RIFCSPHIGHO2_02_FULL_56_12]|nr:MAG: hypothetical protein A3C56_13665 [Ignavibacteria bacterium RIFCSPHIGHO2_02_FULL_56_12]
MKQVVQYVKTGEIKLEELPIPALKEGHVLVQVRFSVISAGTERSSIAERSQSLLQRARKNPDLVAKVLDQIRKNGLRATARRVKGQLETLAALGYSAAGEIVSVGEGVQEFKPGDRVACGGAGLANHAEYIVVPRNLCVKVAANADLVSAAYTTIGAIALQGIRQAAPTLGETVAVIGLGLVGQLTVQLLKANGCLVIGIDPDPAALTLAKTSGADSAYGRQDDVRRLVRTKTGGVGADAVIITAATKSDDPVRLAGDIARDRGRVVIVGDVGLRLPRAPYYMKELDFRLSRSYGPGRYDPSYEDHGTDYPIGYVRWTERRNMEEFVRLVAEGSIHPDTLTTHRYPIEKVRDAFAALTAPSKGKRAFGVVLAYGDAPPVVPKKTRSIGRSAPTAGDPLNIGFIGAGSFAQSMLLPPLKQIKGVKLVSVCTATGPSATNVARQFGFAHSTTEFEDVLGRPEIGTVFIASRHDLHARIVFAALSAGKNVFVEKPLVMRPEELLDVERLYAGMSEDRRPLLMVGFNRRFAPSIREIRTFFASVDAPLAVDMRIHAGYLPPSHWSRDPQQGGGRIVGEMCHFIDIIQFVCGAEPARVFAEHIGSATTSADDDSVVCTLKLNNGSVATVSYLANGDVNVPKEYLQVFGGGRTAVLDNYRRLTTYRQEQRFERAWSTVDKGHHAEVRSFMEAVRMGSSSPITFAESVAATRATFAVEESLKRGGPISL